jgi:hypothetical protein
MPRPSKPWPSWLLGVLGVLGLVLCLGLAIMIRVAPLWTATAKGRDVAIWLLTPHLAPGDVARVDVDVFGGKRAALRAIEVSGEGIEARRALEGATWGSVIVSTSRGGGHASEQIEVRVPESAEPGQKIDLKLRVRYTLAVSRGGGLTNEHPTEELGLRLYIKSPMERSLDRAWSAFVSLALFGVVVALYRRVWHRLASLMTRKDKNGQDSSLATSLGLLAIAGIIVSGFVGWVVFALPLASATGFTSDWFQAAMGAIWLFAPPLIGRKLAGKPPPPPLTGKLRRLDLEPERAYRAAPPAPKELPSLKTLAAEIQKSAGLRVALEAEAIEVRRARRARPLVLEVQNPKRVRPEEIAVETAEARLAMEVILALVPLLGPVELELDDTSIAIDGAKSADALEKEWEARAVEVTQARVDALRRELLDRLGRRA